MEALKWSKPTVVVMLAATHLTVGAVLICLLPLFSCVMEYERACVYAFCGVMPLVPCIGFGWMVIGSLLLLEKSPIYQVTRALHIAWLFIVGCVAAVGIVIIGLNLLAGFQSIGWFGFYLLSFCAVLFAISIRLLFLLRDLRCKQFSETTDSLRPRIYRTIITLTLSVVFAGIAIVWQAHAGQQRQIAEQRIVQEELQNFAYDSGAVKSLTFSLDCKYLATAIEFDYSHRGVRVWEVDSGKLCQEIDGGLKVLDLAFTPDAARLIVCYEEQWNTGGFIIVDTENGTELFRSSEVRTSSVAVSADGQFLVACGNVGYGNPSLIAPFSIWNLETFEKVYESKPENGYVSAAFSKSGSRLAVRRQKAIEVWSFPLTPGVSPVQSWDPRMGAKDVKSISFFADDTKLAAIGVFGSNTWRAADAQGDISTLPTAGPTNAGAFADDRSQLVVANQQQAVLVIDLQTETIAHEFKAPFWVDGIAIASVNQLIALGGHQRVFIVEADTGKLVRELAQRDRNGEQ